MFGEYHKTSESKACTYYQIKNKFPEIKKAAKFSI